ncbi:7,8-dihydropteroate synthase [Wigglesworthia glossinidia endosymbiont of Glossina morsitans morsitans (Yale colony)]|uniref:Dihydropteroate synthase n=1 Tax=Wigglesworthia glossinidia endosymbiont of Glossina morsitans morsitans (Yale colony) TaxID=1142511 RepID=H6Q587_WIGGL|nr:dihydropteroate synthase [Wigglesworthia glossinidia]AFA41370.1 7,8-dihydropteroate synthase [Wigglesworthia glossinidia endosymbiont of Glossina morsitans morsitans (Yale colony)]
MLTKLKNILSKPCIMGILNVTPDSFSDGGQFTCINKAINHVRFMIDSGAKIIDVGGESSRPGAKRVSELEESERVIPIIEYILKKFNVFVSVNTSHFSIMQECIKLGVHIINDIRSFSECNSLHDIIDSDVMLCLMHMKGNPENMQKFPQYKCIKSEIKEFFTKKISFFINQGIKKNRIIIDPGFGFGKNMEHNYHLLANLKIFLEFQVPILVGFSRKVMTDINKKYLPNKRIIGSIVCAILACIEGASIIRVHDVQETVDALSIFNAFISEKNLLHGTS